MNTKWIKTEDAKPLARYAGGPTEACIISDDVAVYFGSPHGDGSIDIANYDYDTAQWSLPNRSFEQPDLEPTHWFLLPETPE